MAFERPTLTEIVERSQADFVSRLETMGAVLRRSVVHVLARVVAGASHMLHGHLDYVSRQIFPDLSERDFLLRQASLYGIQPSPATFAEAVVTVTGTDGAPVPTGTVLLRSDGAEYVTTADVTIVDEEAAVPVIAREAGADGTLETGVALTFESPLAGVAGEAFVASSTTAGEDEEDTEDLRSRLLARLQSPPHGGSAADYVAWAREVPGVTRAWCYPGELGAGTVVVRFVRDDDADPLPADEAVAAVQAYIDEVRPVTAAVTVIAPVAVPLAMSIQLVPNTTATRAAAHAELEDLLRRVATPGETIPISRLRGAVAAAEGVSDYTILSPAGDITHAPGELATLGPITWS